MKNTRTLLAYSAMALLALISIAAPMFGYTLFPREATAGLGAIPLDGLATLGMIPFAMAGEISLTDVRDLVVKGNEANFDAHKKNSDKISKLEADLIEVAKKQNRPFIGGDGPSPETGDKPEIWLDAKTGEQIQVLGRNQPMAKRSDGTPTFGRYLRGLVLGDRASDAAILEQERKAMGGNSNTAGGFLVPEPLSAMFIDLLRAKMVLTEAGAQTVPMSGKTLTLARQTAEPTVIWHGENADITSSKPTFGAITLSAKTVVCRVKLSLELSQDAPNIETILSDSLTKALASAIDSAGINGVSGTGAGAAPAGLVDLTGRNSVTSIGAPTSWDFMIDGLYELMADNVDLANVGALVAHPAVWKKMRKLKTGITNDNTPLLAPDEVAKMRKLWTTAAPLSGGTTATGIIADWRDLLFGVRKDISVQVLTTSMGSNLQLEMIAYARVDFAPTRPQSFCTLEGITV